jgi:hypothetical protein
MGSDWYGNMGDFFWIHVGAPDCRLSQEGCAALPLDPLHLVAGERATSVALWGLILRENGGPSSIAYTFFAVSTNRFGAARKD